MAAKHGQLARARHAATGQGSNTWETGPDLGKQMDHPPPLKAEHRLCQIDRSINTHTNTPTPIRVSHGSSGRGPRHPSSYIAAWGLWPDK